MLKIFYLLKKKWGAKYESEVNWSKKRLYGSATLLLGLICVLCKLYPSYIWCALILYTSVGVLRKQCMHPTAYHTYPEKYKEQRNQSPLFSAYACCLFTIKIKLEEHLVFSTFFLSRVFFYLHRWVDVLLFKQQIRRLKHFFTYFLCLYFIYCTAFHLLLSSSFLKF